MENWKEIFASFGLWSLVDDISDDGDGQGDNLQLTKDGELFVSKIQQELDRAREEGYQQGVENLYKYGHKKWKAVAKPPVREMGNTKPYKD